MTERALALPEPDTSVALVSTPAVSLTAAPHTSASPVDVYLAGIAQSSRRTMLARLRILTQLLGASDPRGVPWHELRYVHASALRQALADRYPPSTANLTLSALRGVLRACWRMGLMSAEDYHTTASVSSVTGERLPKGRALSGAELAALLRVCSEDRSSAGPRDAALFALLYACGLRRSEATGLDVADYDTESGAIRVRRAKRNKERLVYIADAGARDALSDWLRVRARSLKPESGPLFVAIDKSNRLATAALSSDGVNKIVAARARAVEMPKVTPHDFRRTFVGDLLDAGADVGVVQRLAGHSNVQTTLRYDRRPEAAKQRAAALLRVPYRSRGEG